MTSRTYTVEGMSCQHCIDAITSEVAALAGVGGVSVDLQAGTVTVSGERIDDAAVRAAVDEAGYQVTG
jgi:copper chaperone